MRRGGLLGGLLVGAAMALGGCSTSGSAEESSTSVASTAADTAPSSMLPVSTVPTDPVEQDVDEIDFDALYRQLDAERTRAWETNDADLLATISPRPGDLALLRERAATGEHLVRRDSHDYRIDAVTVFDRIGDDDVVLRVVDTIQGVTDLVDADGEVIRSHSRNGNLQQAFIVWMHRSDDGWMILSDDGGFTVLLPGGPQEFEEMARLEVGGREVVLSGAEVSGVEVCLLATSWDSVPWVDCLSALPAAGGTVSGLGRYTLDVDERWELALAIGRDADSSFELRLGSIDPLPVDQPFGDRLRFVAAAAEPGTFDLLELGFVDGSGMVAEDPPPSVDLDEFRAGLRERRSLFPER